MGAYLNQDWPEEYGTLEAAVDDFATREPRAGDAVQEIHILLAQHGDEAGLRKTISQLGASYAADWDGGTYRGWLEEVARRVTAALKQQTGQGRD